MNAFNKFENEQKPNNENHFSKYGRTFQEKIFQSMMIDHSWASQMIEIMTSGYFELKYLQYLCDRFFNFYNKYKNFPTLQLLVSIIKDELTEGDDVILKSQVIEFLSRIKSSPSLGDLQYVKDKTLDFCKKQVLRQALEDSVKAISAENYDSVLSIMKDAVAKGSPSTVGHVFFDDYEARFTKINRITCPTGIKELDKKDVLNGGLARGEIGVITAPTGVGKSHWLVQMGASALRVGKNVIHYTFELTETSVGIRYDSNLCDIPSSDVQDRKEEVLKQYEDNNYGRLIIKEYPTGGASIMTIRNHIEKLMMKDFIPSLIVIDYADIMRSTRKYDSLRHELKLIYEELRNLAMEMSVPIWTASQANREAADKDVVGLNNMSEAYGKAMVADLVISISRKQLEKSLGTGRLFVAKNRAGRDGILFPVRIDTSKSKIEIVDDPQALSMIDMVDSNHRGTKDMLKQKWKEIVSNA
jgi:replicative DNA helicase